MLCTVQLLSGSGKSVSLGWAKGIDWHNSRKCQVQSNSAKQQREVDQWTETPGWVIFSKGNPAAGLTLTTAQKVVQSFFFALKHFELERQRRRMRPGSGLKSVGYKRGRLHSHSWYLILTQHGHKTVLIVMLATGEQVATQQESQRIDRSIVQPVTGSDFQMTQFSHVQAPWAAGCMCERDVAQEGSDLTLNQDFVPCPSRLYQMKVKPNRCYWTSTTVYYRGGYLNEGLLTTGVFTAMTRFLVWELLFKRPSNQKCQTYIYCYKYWYIIYWGTEEMCVAVWILWYFLDLKVTINNCCWRSVPLFWF